MSDKPHAHHDEASFAWHRQGTVYCLGRVEHTHNDDDTITYTVTACRACRAVYANDEELRAILADEWHLAVMDACMAAVKAADG